MTDRRELEIREKILLYLKLVSKERNVDGLDIVAAVDFPVHEVYAELFTLEKEGIIERNYFGLHTWYSFVQEKQ